MLQIIVLSLPKNADIRKIRISYANLRILLYIMHINPQKIEYYSL